MVLWGVKARAVLLCVTSVVTGLFLNVFLNLAPVRADIFDPVYYQPTVLPQLHLAAYDLAPVTPFAMMTPRAAEPFGAALSMPDNDRSLRGKWAAAKKALQRDEIVLQHCRDDAAACPAPAKNFLAIVERAHTRSGWSRIAEVNRSVNLSIRAVSDMEQYGVRDLWASPLRTFESKAGDCEDNAIAKYAALRQLGYGDDALRLVIVHDNTADEDHLVLTVRHEERWLVLDSKTLDIREDSAIVAFDPLFMIDGEGVKKITGLTPKIAPQPTPAIDTTAYFATVAFAGWRMPPTL